MVRRIRRLGWQETLEQLEPDRQRRLEFRPDRGKFHKVQQLLETHGSNPRVNCLHEMIGFDPRKDSIDYIFSKTPMPKVFDFMSIDIDGNDYHIWNSLVRYRPRVIMLEFKWDIPNDVVFIQDRDWSVSQNSSLRAMVELGKRRCYELACVIGANAIFLNKDDFPKLGIADNHIDSMYFAHRDAKIFLLYDGTLAISAWGIAAAPV